MSKRLLPQRARWLCIAVLLLAGAAMHGCPGPDSRPAVAPPPPPVADHPSQPAPQPPAAPTDPPATVAPGADQPVTPPTTPPATAAPDPADVDTPAADPGPQAPDGTGEPGVVPAQPGRWYPAGVGGPVTTDDPGLKDHRVVVLTFDDGPHPIHTPMVLDTLKAYQVPAVFFVTHNALRYPELIARIDNEGHVIGNHTLQHRDLRELSRAEQRAEITALNEAIQQVTGRAVRYFRPPFGAYNADTEALMVELDMVLVNWGHGSADWIDTRDGYKDPAEVVADTLAEQPRSPGHTPLHPGAIILMHDTLRHTAEALPAILEGLRELGYEVVSLAE